MRAQSTPCDANNQQCLLQSKSYGILQFDFQLHRGLRMKPSVAAPSARRWGAIVSAGAVRLDSCAARHQTRLSTEWYLLEADNLYLKFRGSVTCKINKLRIFYDKTMSTYERF